MQYTDNYRFMLPEVTEQYSVDHSNDNWRSLDELLINMPSAPYVLALSIRAEAWTGTTAPYVADMTRLSNVRATDHIIIMPAIPASDDETQIREAYACITEVAPTANGLRLTCRGRKPTRALSLMCVGLHTNGVTGSGYLTDHALSVSSGGGAGTDGREIELRKGTTAIEWRYVGDATWQTLVPLADITGPQGPRGARGATGATGAQGPAGQGIPTGGTAGQVLVKRSGTDYDTNWATPTSGGGGTPYAHASTHAAGGSDPITPASIRAAPTSHASNTTGYGAGNGTNYGHLKLSDSVNSTLGISGGTAAAPVAVKAAYDLANGKADAGHNHDDRYALIGHTHSGGSGGAVEYKTITVPASGWVAADGSYTQQAAVSGITNTDYLTAKYTSNAINIADRAADHAAYCCITDGTPTPGGVLLICLHERPTRDIRMLLRVEHGGTSGYMAMTGQAQPSSGTKTANGSVITAEQTITVAGLGFRPSMVTFVGGSGKATATQGYGAVSGDTTVARYADATGVGHTGTFAPTDDGFEITVQGAGTKTLNVGWQAVGD